MAVRGATGRALRMVTGTLIALFVVMMSATPSSAASPARIPVVMFPAFHFTRLRVDVRAQTVVLGCPRNGTFVDGYRASEPGSFSPECRDRLLTLRYHPVPGPPDGWFSEVPGVRVTLDDEGSTRSAPAYESLYRRLEAAGYRRDVDVRVAGYDSRLTPDLGDFLPRTIRLIEETSARSGNLPVRLVGHSNGPLYAQYLLTHTSRAWRARYVQGFTSIAGNLPGQGSTYGLPFTGLNTDDFSYPTTPEAAQASARSYLSAPSTYMSMADARVFGDREVVVRDVSTGRSYTPRDAVRLFRDAHLPVADDLARRYIGFVRFRDPADFPMVDTSAEMGSGLPTPVGVVLPDLRIGTVVDPGDDDRFLTRDGDSNQEDVTNQAAGVWRGMRCHRFRLTDHPGVGHFDLPSNPDVLSRLVDDLRQPRSPCPPG